MDQKFYKEYLNSYNYKNLFKNKFEKVIIQIGLEF